MTAPPRPIPLAKPILGPEEEAAVLETLRSGQIGPGPRVSAFEAAFAEAHGARHGVACANGTLALELMLRALGIGPGHEVVVPAFTFVATANAVLAVGARPVFVDVDASLSLDPADVRRAVTARTRAVLAVHIYGNPADLDALQAAAPGALLLEDAAQAHAARYRGRPVGALGAAGTFSFYPTKNMTTGEGGMLLTNLPELADAARSIANQGRAPDAVLGTYDHVRWGTNFRMTDLAAAIGLAQLPKLEGWTQRRRENAQRLTESLSGMVETPVERAGDRHVFHQYTIRVPRRDRVLAELKKAGVGAGVYYPKPLPAYPHLAAFARPCPQAERATREVLSLPVHPLLSEDDLARIVAAVRGAVA